MKVKLPCIAKASDLLKFFQKMPEKGVPESVVDASFIKKMGYSAASSASLADILMKLGFVNEDQQPTYLWSEFVTSEERAAVLARAIHLTYANLFRKMMYPYLADDESLFDYMRATVNATPREMGNCLDAFRVLCSMADFQDILCDCELEESSPQPSQPEARVIPLGAVDPERKVIIELHIDAGTPDEKIESIFRYARQYLMG